MGRTVPTFRDALEEHLGVWEREFGRSLPDPKDRECFHRVVQGARRYVAQATMMSTGDRLERILLAVLVSLQRELMDRHEPESTGSPGDVDADGNILVVEFDRRRPPSGPS